jgi:putative colanic acid biosysnthesis UDP-glucose lipid carrier transferase
MSPDQLSPGSLAAGRGRYRRVQTLAAEPTTRRQSPLALSINRALDIAVAGLLLCFLAVPMLLIALAVRLTSRGPAIYKQERTGLGGRSFVMFKFRTMRLDAEAETGPIWSRPGDPRCTRLGAFLRRSSIDELPQLFNVLRGEMSIVGPRPERPFFVRNFSQKLPSYTRRLDVLPGITGWAQVNGWRGDTSLERRLEFDLFYINHWSVPLNLWIMLRTPLAMLFEQNVR